MGKKNLEQLFRENLKDFHEVPDERVWNFIEASLDKKKKKKRVVPLWWQFGGAAAVLAILFFAINPFEDKGGDTINPIIITTADDSETPLEKNHSVTSESMDTAPDIEGLAESETNDASDIDTNSGSGTLSSNKASTKDVDTQRGQLANQSKNNPQNNGYAAINTNGNKKISQTERNSAMEQKDDVLPGKNKDVVQNIIRNEGVAENTKNDNSSENNALLNPENGGQVLNNAIAENNMTKKTLEKNAVADPEELNEEQNEVPEKKSIYEVLKEQEEEAVTENTNSKWSVGPSVAPIYYNGAGEGSPIHSNFASNSKSGNVNLSYGLTVAYNLNKKLTIRSGVHKVNFGYDTNDIVFSSSFGASADNQIENINYSQTSRNIVVQSKSGSANSITEDFSAELLATENAALDGKMVQELGYIEVPVELNYTLVDKKIGVDLIGGVSSLFLVDNSVLLESEGLVTEVGEANNANSVNFSTNIGLGFNYEFTPKVQFNLEPVFKYQLNTFSETAGSFRPFSVGVYSGVRFKF